MDLYLYKFNLNTYKVPPVESCTLLELEKLCEERLRLYKIIDEAHNLEYTPNSSVWEKYVEMQIEHRKLFTYFTLLKNEEYVVGHIKARRNNHIAHWLLRLCYCRSRYLRHFFMRCELYWFVMLYKKMKREDLLEFLIENEVNYSCVTQSEINILSEKLVASRALKEIYFDSVVYYKTKFKNVSNLVRIRKVFLYKGLAYFPESDLIYCIKNKLWRQFNRDLIWMNKMFPTNIKEDRLQNFLKNIIIVTPTYKRFTDRKLVVNLENIDELAAAHFPLCMKNIHSVLRKEHHLKYDCKMQYGIFLKWVGLSYQHAMEFWKNEFTQKMSSDWFHRKYLYLFKHQYGKVGGMVHYNPYTCEKIINSCPGPGQHHGCPFKHWDLERLLEKCRLDGFTAEDLYDLKDLVINNKYKDACTVYFSLTHKVHMRDIIQSPNQYVEASYEFEESLNNCLNHILDDYKYIENITTINSDNMAI